MGAAEARLFVSEGAKVVVADVLDVEGHALADELGKGVRFVELDVTQESAWDEAIREAAATFGPVNVLVNNAGIALFSPIAGMSLDDYLKVVMVNQVGVFLGMRAVIPEMIKGGGGSIINVSSIDGLLGTPMGCAYVASKFAVRGMTKVAALELASAGIRVNSIHPGGVRTPMLDFLPGVDLASLIAPTIPLGRVAEPDEVARLALFLASAESSYCTGSEFVIDGGLTCGVATELDRIISSVDDTAPSGAAAIQTAEARVG
jgi:3alpha(or 20beta)-hydroxysteroid dehydrogenase